MHILIPSNEGLDFIVEDMGNDEGATRVFGSPADADYNYEWTNLKPKLITQGKLNKLVRDLCLSKENQNFLLEMKTKWEQFTWTQYFSYYWKPNFFILIFSGDCLLCYVYGLFTVMSQIYVTSDQHPFIDL